MSSDTEEGVPKGCKKMERNTGGKPQEKVKQTTKMEERPSFERARNIETNILRNLRTPSSE